MKLTVEDTLYFSANDGIHGEELWAYNTTTDEMWMVADIRPADWAVSDIGWAFNTARKFSLVPSPTMPGTNSGHTTTAQAQRGWLPTSVMTSPSPSGSNPGDDMELMYGNTLYFSAFTLQYATELWACNTITGSSWLVHDIHMGSSANRVGT